MVVVELEKVRLGMRNFEGYIYTEHLAEDRHTPFTDDTVEIEGDFDIIEDKNLAVEVRILGRIKAYQYKTVNGKRHYVSISLDNKDVDYKLLEQDILDRVTASL